MEEQRDIFHKCRVYDIPRQIKSAGLYPYFRAIESTSGSSVVTDGKPRVMIGSNNYLGFTHHPRVRAAAKKAVERYGTGCTGSRFLNGNLKLHEELEERLAEFLEKEAALVYSTGFLANHGSISCLPGRKDVIYSDRENHASIYEGLRVAICDKVKFRHNDMEDLERVLKKTRDQYKGAMIVADGVFSMSGDILKLPEIVKLSKKYDCRIYVDDAHALGVLGKDGRGTAHHFGLEKEVDLIMGTFSKSFACSGGYVAGDADVIDYIRHNSRTFMFSAAMQPSAAATVLECLKIVVEEPEHLRNLWKNVEKIQKGLKSLGFNTLGSRTPVIPILVGDDSTAFAFTQRLYQEGVFATPVVRPAVPEGCALIRTSYMATHSEKELNFVLEVMGKLGHEFDILGNSRINEKLAELASTHFGVKAFV